MRVSPSAVEYKESKEPSALLRLRVSSEICLQSQLWGHSAKGPTYPHKSTWLQGTLHDCCSEQRQQPCGCSLTVALRSPTRPSFAAR